MVTVRGPQCILEHARFITTQPYDFAADPECLEDETVVQGQVDLVTEMGGRPIQAHPGRVTFTCRVLAKAAERSTPAPAASGHTEVREGGR